MAENIIQIGDFSVARKGRVDRFDCGVQVSAYWALDMVAERIKSEWSKLQGAKDRLAEDKSASLHLVAARAVEKAWRKRDMVPCCPHCGEGVSAADGFGQSLVSKRIDDARRQARKGKRND